MSLMRRRMMMGQGGEDVLPDGYIPLQYIECTGAQYISLTLPRGANYDYSNLIIEANWYATSLGSNRTIYGWYSPWPGYNPTCQALMANYDGYWYYGKNTNSNSLTGVARVSISLSTDTWYKSRQDINGVVLNNATYSYNRTASLPIGGNDKLLIGGYYNDISSSSNAQFQGYFGDIIISAASGVLFKLTPAQNANNEVGFYDFRNSTFLTSGSSTPFIAGSTI